MAKDLAALMDEARQRGFPHDIFFATGCFRCEATGEFLSARDTKIIDTLSVAAGSDPGDDATIYLLEAPSGTRGFLIVPMSAHTDPDKVDLLDDLKAV
jgi:hypothetical protein